MSSALRFATTARLLRLLLALVSMAGLPAVDISLSVDQPLPVVGSTITVSVNLNNAAAFDTWGLQVDFNASYLQLISESAGSYATFVPDARSLSMINASSEIHLGGYSPSNTNNSGGATGTLAVLQFLVLYAGSPTISTIARDGTHPFGDTLFNATTPTTYTSVVPVSDAPLTINARNLDVVQLNSAAVNATASGSSDGSFTITRSGSIGSITVPLEVGGTAVPGTDYVALPSSVTFTPGLSSITLPIHGLDNSAIDGTQTIDLDILPGSSYTIGASRSSEALLLDDLGPTTSITVDHSTVQVGQTLTVTVSIANAPTFLEWGEMLSWSAGSLQLVSQSAGDFNEFVPDARSTAMIDSANEVHAGGYGSANGSGRLAVFTFQVLTSGNILLSAPAQGVGEPFGLALFDASNHLLVPLAAPPVTVTSLPADVMTISSSQPIASTDGPTPAYVTVSRDRTADAQTVSLLASGTTSPSLWVSVPSSVSFAIGQSSVTFPLLPVDNHVIEGTLSLILTIGPGQLYTVGNPSSVTITRLDADGSDLSLTANTPRPALSGTVQVMIHLDQAPAFSQFGGIVKFPVAMLSLASQGPGSGSFGTFVPDARTPSEINASGEVHIGTYTTDDQAGGSGDLVVLTFNVIGSGTAVLTTADQTNGVPFGDALLSQAGETTLPTISNVLTLQISADHAPTAIALSNTHVRQGLPVGTLVGLITDTDQDVGDYASYALVGSGAPSADNAKFTISGNELLTDYVFDYSLQSTAAITIQATDSGGDTYQQSFTITIDPGGGVLYVLPSATGTPHDGSSWSNAFTDLAPALAAANSGTQVWVAAGTYLPTAGTDTTQSLTIPAGVAVYGGFSGTESTLSRQWPQNLTTLSGVISGGASRHVVTLSAGATLDGVVVSGGYASNAFSDQDGAGVLVGSGAATAALTHCIITGNHAATSGGGVYSQGAPTVIANCVLDTNLADAGCGGFGAASGSHSLIADTLTNNSGFTSGAAEVTGSAGIAVLDCVFDANTVPALNDASTAALTYTSCCVPDGGVANGDDLGSNLNVDPLLMNVMQPDGADGIWFTSDDGVQLSAVSPCRLAGANAGLPDDLFGNPRPSSGGVDMGACEFEVTGGTAPTITSPLTASGTVGTPFSFALAASGTAPISFTASPLPDGLALSQGVISGTPQSAGTTDITINAANGVAYATPVTLVVTIGAAGAPVAPVLTCPLSATAYVGVPFSFPITTTGTQPVAVAASPLPPGLSLFGSNIQGTPTAVSTTYINLGASNSAGIAAPQSLLLTIVQPVAPSFIGPTNVVAILNQPFSSVIGANGTLPITFTASPLPQGLTLSNGTISGTPTVTGATVAVLTATNVAGSATPQDLTINVDIPATITSPLTASGTVGTAFTYTPTASGTTPISFTAAPLPAGLTFDGTTVSGTPTTNGTTMMVITATNPTGPTSVTVPVTITTLAPPVFTSNANAFGTVAAAFSFPLATTGALPITYAVTSGTLGDGLSLANGVISGTPGVANTQSVTITATGPGGQASQVLTLTMEVPAGITSALTASGYVGTAFSYTIVSNGTNLSYAATPLPPGLTLAGNVISGTPTMVGPTTVVLDVTNDISADSENLMVTIAAAVAPVITSSPTVADALGMPLNFQMAADGTQPISYAVTSGTLPLNLSLSSSGLISGTPAAVGSTTVTVTATNTFGTNPQDLTIVIQVPPGLPGDSTDSGTVGAAYSYTIASTGTGPQTYTATPLPPGLNLVGNVISGTPTMPGSTVIALSASNLVGTATQNLTLNIAPAVAPIITSAASALGTVGQPFTFTLTASGTPPPTFTQSGLPGGLTLNSGVISGTPSAAGVSDVTITATNAGGQNVQDLQLTFQVPAMISSPLSASGTVGTPFSYTLTANGTAPITLNATGLPSGLTYAGGVITGTPTGAGSTTIVLTAANLVNTDTENLSLTVVAATAPLFTSDDTAVATVGAPFTFTLAASGSTPLVFTTSMLPNGLVLNNGVISGTPTDAGIFPVTVTATNAGGAVNQTLTITQQIPPAITSANSAVGTVGSPFSYQITATGTSVSFSTSLLPAGLMLLGDTISGAPTGSGTTLVTLMAGNLVGNDSETLTITISAATAPVITSSASAVAEVGSPFSLTLTASGSQPITFSATGLPANLSLSGGVISGVVAAAGVYPIQLTASNAGGTGTQTLDLTAQVAPAITNNPLTATATVGTPFTFTVTDTGTAPITIGATGLPTGLSMVNGVISGVPMQSGTFPVALSAANLVATDNETLTLTVLAATAPTISSPATALSTDNQPFSFTLTATGSTPITFSTTTLPAGLSLSGSTISGTPSLAGVYSITVTASNAGGTGTQTLVLTIQDPAMISSPLTASGTVGVPFSYTITATGSTPITDTATGLPPGLTFSGGVISGTPTAIGVTLVPITAGNLVNTDSQSLQISIVSATGPVITSAPTVVAPVGAAFSFTLTASGIPAPTFSTTTLPSGLSLAGSTITGLPSSPGVFMVTVTAANPGGTVTQVLTITLQVPPALAPPSGVQGTVGTPFTYTINATGTALTYQAAPLPDGLTLSGNVISGTPTTSGVTAVVLVASNEVGSVSQTLQLTVVPGQSPVFTSPTTATALVGQFFTYTIAATSVDTVTYATSLLPTGLTLSGAVISGTPVSAGVDPITLSATNLNGLSQQLLTLTVEQAPQVVSPLAVSGTVGTPLSYTIISGGSSPQTDSAAPLPPGLSLAGNVISGTPTTAGITDTVLTVSNAAGSTSPTLVITITASNRPVITSSLALEGTLGAKLDYTITASGTAPITFGASPLPPGMSLSGADLGGVPSAVGITDVVLTASNGGGSATPRTLVITIDPATPPVITSPATAAATIGAPFLYSIAATGSQPITFGASPLPPGLVRTGQTISGTPTVVGITPVTLTAVNAGGSATPLVLTLTVNAAVPPSLTSPLTLSGTVGVPLSYLLTAVGTPPISFAASSLPAGLSLVGAVISGTPTTPGMTPVGVTISDATGQTTIATLAVTIDAAVAPLITSSLTANATAGTPFSYTITASGSLPLSFSASPLPSWLTLTGALLSGTPPDASGSPLSITLGAMNSGGTAPGAVLTLTVQVAVAPTITSPGTADFTVGTPASFALSASGSQPVVFSLSGGTLPAGLALSGAAITGTPSAATAGTTVQLTASNAGGAVTQMLTVVVAAATIPTITVAPSLNGIVGSPFVAYITGLGSSPLTYQTTALPGGLTLTGNLISGTPQMAGQTLVGLTVTNGAGTAQANVLIVIVAATPPAITSATTITATVGVPLLYQISDTGTAPVTLGVSALPPGLALNGTSISGTPTTVGTTVVTLTASNGGGTTTTNLTITVQPAVAPQITSPATASGVILSTVVYTITASGTAPLTITTGPLPAGFSLGAAVAVNGATQALLVGILPATPQQLQISLQAQNAAGQATQMLTLTVTPPAPVVTTLAPLAGPDTGGTSLTLTGTDLDQVTGVACDGLAATIVSSSATALVVTTPAHADGFVAVSFTYAGGSGLAAQQYGYLPLPSVISIAPTTSPTAGGIAVTINGTNLIGLPGFDDQPMATFDGIPARITFTSETSVVVQVPAHAAGTVDVVLSSLAGTLTFSNAFTYSDSAVTGTGTFGVTGAQTTAGASTAAGGSGGPAPGPADDTWAPRCGLGGGMSLVVVLGVWLARRRRGPLRRG